MRANADLNLRPDYDQELQDIADYALSCHVVSADAWTTARYCLMDTLGCGLLALRFPECTRLLGPLVEGTVVPHGARVPGTDYRLDPATAAWDIGCMNRWLDYNDTWLAAEWGFYDVLFSPTCADLALKAPAERRFRRTRAYSSHVMENVLFKIAFPAEFHAQTACEAAGLLHPQVKARLEQIEKIIITTHESAIRIISKTGPLANPADRDHCLQSMAAVPLIFGDLVAEHYADSVHAAHPLIDVLRDKMEVVEDARHSAAYHAPDQRSIANALQVFFHDGPASRWLPPLSHSNDAS